jgi:hypothetical protein
MKKITLLFAIILVAVALSGCGAKTTDKFSLAKDMGISVKGTWYPIHTNAAPLLAAIGGEYELFAAPSCLFVGEDKEFAFQGCSVFTNPDGKIDLWYIIEFRDATLSTARGIHVGSTLKDIVAAYGDKYYKESDYQIAYSVSGVKGDLASPCIIFDLKNDVVEKVSIYYPTNAK